MKKLTALILSLALLLSFSLPSTAASYINGMSVDGAQVRVDGAMGLRFVTTLQKSKITSLEEAGAENITYGTLLSLENGTLEIGKNTESEAKNIYKTTDSYVQFTAVVINIPKSQFQTKIYVRPYVSYYLNGNRNVIYGETYSADLFAVADTAYKSGNETDSVNNYLLTKILEVVNPKYQDQFYTGGIYKP